ncbi:glycerol-3-phosphate dehydrogenase [Shimia sp.]|uniref:glycerol-3-phosphate dehydrogenase n=1 Tax=Shimia sp. TaxID=1954381 RepID=UPI003567D159
MSHPADTFPERAAVDLFVIGGGVNGCGIARDAAGRGLTVELAEMNDLASATSSASTKLFHGGLRYLEFFEFRLVREALAERERLLRAMPHISWPMRFVLPLDGEMRFAADSPASRLISGFMPWLGGRRPGWMIRAGLFLYDHLGRRGILPGTTTIDLGSDAAGAPLDNRFRRAYEYSDCWVDDSRLVALNARDAAARGARILTRTRVERAERDATGWRVTTRCTETGALRQTRARMLINAAGPWAAEVIRGVAGIDSADGLRLVRGSHIVTRKLFDHDRAYFFQGADGRIVFAIPYEGDFTLIGTTDVDQAAPDPAPVCSEAEADYLCHCASRYFRVPVRRQDIVWRFSGLRPLYDDGAASATAATRDYVLGLDTAGGAPVLSVFGGKITTYRRLAEAALDRIAPFVPGLPGPWTAGAALPGGDFPVDGAPALTRHLLGKYRFLDASWARRLVRAYGTEAEAVLGEAVERDDLGRDFGATLCQREVVWLMTREFARRAEDVVWRRSKLGLRLDAAQIAALDDWMRRQSADRGANSDREAPPRHG